MANHKSALKRARQSEVKRLRNRSYKTRIKNAVKAVRMASTEVPEVAKEKLVAAMSILHKSVSKGVIHKKQAARRISRLALLLNKSNQASAS